MRSTFVNSEASIDNMEEDIYSLMWRGFRNQTIKRSNGRIKNENDVSLVK